MQNQSIMQQSGKKKKNNLEIIKHELSQLDSSETLSFLGHSGLPVSQLAACMRVELPTTESGVTAFSLIRS